MWRCRSPYLPTWPCCPPYSQLGVGTCGVLVNAPLLKLTAFTLTLPLSLQLTISPTCPSSASKPRCRGIALGFLSIAILSTKSQRRASCRHSKAMTKRCRLCHSFADITNCCPSDSTLKIPTMAWVKDFKKPAMTSTMILLVVELRLQVALEALAGTLTSLGTPHKSLARSMKRVCDTTYSMIKRDPQP